MAAWRRIKALPGAVSRLLGGRLGFALFVLVALLDWVGRLAVAAELLRVNPSPDLILLPAAALLAANVLFRQTQRASRAELQANSLRAELDARPDPKQTTRTFLELHDLASEVVFTAKVPYEEGYIDKGIQGVNRWLGVCENLINQEAPEWIPEFRRAAQLGRRDLTIPWVRVDDDPTHYDIATPPVYEQMVERVRTVLERIIEGGRR